MIKTNDKIDRMLRDIFNGSYVTKIGILSGDAEDPKKVREQGNRIVNSDTSLLQIALIHEFGSEGSNIPERSFLRSTFADKNKDWARDVQKIIKAQVKNNVYNPHQISSKFGAIAVGDVQKKFTSNNWEKLQPSTINARLSKFTPKYRKQVEGRARERKKLGFGVFRPLIDTGQLRASISFSVIKVK